MNVINITFNSNFEKMKGMQYQFVYLPSSSCYASVNCVHGINVTVSN